MADEIITKRLHVSGLNLAITPADLSQKLGSFGSVKALDGFGNLDALGQPKKFGYVTIETTKLKLARCMNLLSGVTWKGANLRIGEAKPDFRERLTAEREAAEGEPPRKKRRLPRGVQGVQAADMSLVTPENVSGRGGWKVTPLGRLIKPMRMRPEKPLPEQIVTTATVKGKGKQAKEAEMKKKKKRTKVPPVRARRRTIDPLKYGSQQIKGVFLENAAAGLVVEKRMELPSQQAVQESSDESTLDEAEVEGVIEDAETEEETVDEPLPQTSVLGEKPNLLQKPPSCPPAVAEKKLPSHPPASIDIAQEKHAALGLLQSLFGNRDDSEWGDKESLGSDLDTDDIAQREGGLKIVDDEDDVEVVPMDIDDRQSEYIAQEETQTSPPEKSPPARSSAPASRQTKLKDLFAPREEEAGFSLLGHLDLEDEFDEDLDATFAPQAPNVPTADIVPSISLPSTSAAQVRFTLDQFSPLFFPIPEDERTGFRGRLKGPLDVAREKGWDWRKFCRTQTSEEIKQEWEEQKVELTKDWKRRHREAIKSRRRRGGAGDGE